MGFSVFSCTTIPTIFFFSKKPHTLWLSPPLSHPHLNPMYPLIYLLSLYICLFWTCHISGTIQYVVFCDWLLSFNIVFSSLFWYYEKVFYSFLLPNNLLYGDSSIIGSTFYHYGLRSWDGEFILDYLGGLTVFTWPLKVQMKKHLGFTWCKVCLWKSTS